MTACQVACTLWFKDRGIAMLGTDTSNDVRSMPSARRADGGIHVTIGDLLLPALLRLCGRPHPRERSLRTKTAITAGDEVAGALQKRDRVARISFRTASETEIVAFHFATDDQEALLGAQV